jgi:hypothetical protein
LELGNVENRGEFEVVGGICFGKLKVEVHEGGKEILWE